MSNSDKSKKGDKSNKDSNNDKTQQKTDSSTSGFNQLIADTYKVGKKIGSGSYGEIRLGTNVKTSQIVAIKFESASVADPQLKTENDIYALLQGKKGFPTIHFFGSYMNHNVLVMEMLGRNLESVFELCGRKFTLKATIFIVLQLLKRFQDIHQCKVVYRDVKPENFMLGARSNTVYVIDFGLSRPYCDSANRHIAFQQTNELTGTSRYMSINAHQCKEQSRRDDLEALGYVFLYFLRGKLPWSGLKADGFKEHNKMICNLKRDIPDEELCKGFPEEFLIYLKYVRSLKFEQEPTYERMRNMFKKLFRANYKDDGIFDWNN